jgi:magnesium chelatase subunit I
VAFNLLNKAIRSQFIHYFPNPELLKKRKQEGAVENPYKPILQWFDKGNSLSLLNGLKDDEKKNLLYQVDGLHALVKKHFKHANEQELTLMMEFLLHGLASFSLINKKLVDGRIEFNDLMSSMINLGPSAARDEDEDYDGEDFT